MNRTIRLVAVDVDGTLVQEGREPTRRVAQAIRRARASGVHVILASGRAFPSVRAYAAPLGLTGPAICYQGSQVRDLETGQVLFQTTLPRHLAEEALRLAEARGLEITIHRDDTVYLRDPQREPDFYAWAFGCPAREVANLQDILEADPVKFLMVGEAALLDRVEPAFRAHFQGRLQVVRSHRLILEGVGLGVSKGQALARVSGHLGVPQAETMAVGDQDNDVPMIQWAGLGVAMGNAPAAVQAAADRVAPPVEADGLAWALETFVLAGQGEGL